MHEDLGFSIVQYAKNNFPIVELFTKCCFIYRRICEEIIKKFLMKMTMFK